MDLKSNISKVKNRIIQAAQRAARNPEDIKLVAVSKRKDAQMVIDAARAGLDTFGENYAQELRDKHRYIEENSDARVKWHFIGSLQKNKVKYLIGNVELIHSLDSFSVAEEISKRALKIGDPQNVLIEINTGGEDSKGGIDPEDINNFLDKLNELKGLSVKGLMTMPPYFDDSEGVRPYFRKLKEINDELKAQYPGLTELSMGMSGDFEVAIEEGATIVRVGTSIFGPRDS